MPSKATMMSFDSDNPNHRYPLNLSPLAQEDLTGEPAYQFTPTGRAEVVAAATVPLQGLLKQRLEEFRAARAAREKAKGKALLDAMKREENAALLLAWTLDQEVQS